MMGWLTPSLTLRRRRTNRDELVASDHSMAQLVKVLEGRLHMQTACFGFLRVGWETSFLSASPVRPSLQLLWCEKHHHSRYNKHAHSRPGEAAQSGRQVLPLIVETVLPGTWTRPDWTHLRAAAVDLSPSVAHRKQTPYAPQTAIHNGIPSSQGEQENTHTHTHTHTDAFMHTHTHTKE